MKPSKDSEMFGVKGRCWPCTLKNFYFANWVFVDPANSGA